MDISHPSCAIRTEFPAQPLAPPRWTAELWLRMRRFLVLKAVGTTAFTWLFFIAYFYLMRHPAYPVTVMPLTWLDRWIPFQPLALLPYLTLWLYVGVAPGLQLGFRELMVYGLWVGALCLAGLCCFYFWPTQVPLRPIDVSGFAGFDMLQGIDAGGNACPSMHVAAAVFSALRLSDVLRQTRTPGAMRWLNWGWAAAIVWSTVAVRQHVTLDVLAGALLGGTFALASLHWRPATPRTARTPEGAAIIIAD